MDCPKCGYTLAPLEAKCSRCQRLAQEEFARSPEAVWPPAIGPAAIEPAPLLRPLPVPPSQKYSEDNSEQNSSGEERGCPLEIAELHWNWGAFWCGWLWCFVNALPGLAVLILAVGALFVYFTLALLPAGYALPSELLALVLFGLHCHLGIHGHHLAWEHRRFYGGIAQYFAVQRAWLVGGGIAFGLTMSVLTLSTLRLITAFHAYEARLQHPLTPPKPIVPSSPPPMILRPASPALSNAPMGLRSPTNGEEGFGRQGLRRPGEFSSLRPPYQPGDSPGDLRTLPNAQANPQAAPGAVPGTGQDAGPSQMPPPASSWPSPPEESTPLPPSGPLPPSSSAPSAEQPLPATVPNSSAPNSSAPPSALPTSSSPTSSTSSPAPSDGSAP